MTSSDVIARRTGSPTGTCKRVDLAGAVRVLRLPHPLLGDDMDFHRVAGRRERGKSRRGRPEAGEEKKKERRRGPADLEIALDPFGKGSALGRRASPVAHGEDDEAADHDQRDNSRKPDQPEIDEVGVGGLGGGLLGKETEGASSTVARREAAGGGAALSPRSRRQPRASRRPRRSSVARTAEL